MLKPPFERPDTTNIEMPEPYGSVLSFIADLQEQLEVFRRTIGGDEFVTPLLDRLDAQFAGLALIVILKGGGAP